MNTKTCIWCCQTSHQTTFSTKAHIVPQSLGGKLLCENVCDNCNWYFGNAQNGFPAIDETIKETFSISRAIGLSVFKEIGKNKSLPRFTSKYFDIDFDKKIFSVKHSYDNEHEFQAKLSTQLIKGIYKMFLESLENYSSSALNPEFNFVREYARYNSGSFPLFYFQRKMGIILLGKPLFQNPDINMNPETMAKYLINHPFFFEFEFLGHIFSIARHRNWESEFSNYASEAVLAKKDHFIGCKEVVRFDDIDFTLKILQN